jgi:iron complex outermembrane receptor protein
MRLFVVCAACALMLTNFSVRADEAATTLGAIDVNATLNVEPGSVEVLDAAAIANANLLEFADLQDAIANLRIGNLGGRATQSMVSLRGYTNPYGAPEAALKIYVDGVPIDDFYSLDLRLFDIARIAVYKGPQGTAFGAGGEAGVIDIVTRAPDATPRAQIDAGFASRNSHVLDAGASGPLSGNVYASLAASKDGGNGYLNNLVGRRDYNGTDGANLRGRLVWKPDERSEVSAMLLAHHASDDGGEIYAPVDQASFDALPSLGGFQLGRFDQAIDAPGFNRGHSLLGAVSASRAGERVRWRATASWRSNDARNLTDYDLSPQPWFTMDSRYRVRQGNLELRAESMNADAAWKWFAGVNANHRDFDFLRILGAGPGNTFQLPVGDYTRTDARLADDSYAAFGQSVWRFGAAQAWSLTAGLRAERAERGVDFRANAVDAGAARLDRADARALPKLALQRRLAPQQFIYASVARGWKPGGYNTDAFSAAQTEFRPEVSTAYEIGFKGTSDCWNYGLAAYRNDIRDYQDLVISESALASYVVNAPRARTQGVEATLDWRPAAEWKLGATFGSVHAMYGNNPLDSATGLNLAGQRLENVPRYNYNVHAQWLRGPWTARVQVAGAGGFPAMGYNADSGVLHVQNVPGYATLDAKFGWRGAHWSAYVFGSNLTDRRYFTSASFGFSLVALYPDAVGNLAPPRTLGVEWRWER